MEEEEVIGRMEEEACWDLLLRSSEHWLAVQTTFSDELGFDWTLFDKDGRVIDGGILIDEDYDWHGAVIAIAEEWCGLDIADFTACLTRSNTVFRDPFGPTGS